MAEEFGSRDIVQARCVVSLRYDATRKEVEREGEGFKKVIHQDLTRQLMDLVRQFKLLGCHFMTAENGNWRVSEPRPLQQTKKPPP